MTVDELLQIAKPILFNQEMVRAILEDRKTVTRRVVKLPSYVKKQEDGLYTLFAEGTCYENQTLEEIENYLKKPYKVGDVLYVRETVHDGESLLYKADNPDLIGYRDMYGHDIVIKWKPSIHMPKKAARIFLEVKYVHFEKLQDITEEQALAEGVPDEWPMNKVYCHRCHGEGLIGTLGPSLGYMEIDCPSCEKAVDRFANLWNSTCGRKGTTEFYSQCWTGNPYVWVIEFERVYPD